jgi:hypothetical protein
MLYHIEKQKGDFIKESFKLSLYEVNLVYVDAFLEARTKISNYEIPTYYMGIHWIRRLDLNLNY